MFTYIPVHLIQCSCLFLYINSLFLYIYMYIYISVFKLHTLLKKNYTTVATQNNKDIYNILFKNLYIYIWFGFQSFQVEDDNPGSPQGSPEHPGDEDGEALDG